ncbi:MAG: hypothetical protein C0501_05105 [Isosphaera sp.]|jgi:hypothetical protein|nr:hypothetical protein [Isosphaera sp.]
MRTYTVHLYREMRLTFTGISADTPEGAVASARDAASEAAASWEDCEGETFSALVDLDGDAEFEHSRVIDFPEGRLRQAAPKLAEALDYLLGQTVDMDLEHGIGLSEGEADAREQALAALAEARGEAGASDPTP